MEELGHGGAAKTIVIRNISTVDRTFYVPAPVQKHFTSAVHRGEKLPEALPYRSKAIAMFQRQDGTDICLFCMYVQEYGDVDQVKATPNQKSTSNSNAGMVYISYLDSVEYFRPRTADSTARTAVYHEIIVSYLAWARRRGFVRAHLWACPPKRRRCPSAPRTSGPCRTPRTRAAAAPG